MNSYKQLTPNNWRGSVIYCQMENFNGRMENFYNYACHSFVTKDCKSIRHIVPKNRASYDIESLVRWFEFVKNECRFDFEISEESVEIPPIGAGSYYRNKVLPEDCYVLTFDPKKYLSRCHLLVALTIVRYCSYNYSERYIFIPLTTFKIKEVYGDNIDNIKALQLAYFINRCNNYSHAFIESNYSYKDNAHPLVGVEDFLKEIKINDINGSLNKDLPKLDPKHDTFYNLWASKNYRYIIDII